MAASFSAASRRWARGWHGLALHQSGVHDVFEGFGHESQTVDGVHLPPRLPAENGGGVEQDDAPHGAVHGGVEEGHAPEAQLLPGIG